MTDERRADSPPPLVLDDRVRRRGSTLIGGSPVRVLRLADEGTVVLDRLLTGERSWSSASDRLARRLLDAGLAHPIPSPGFIGLDAVTVVVPVRDDARGLERLLDSAALDGVARVVVVDDGSRSPDVGEVATRYGADLARNSVSGGPGAARNRGWLLACTDVVAFVDADCLPPPGWLEPLLAHLVDEDVVVVAPRIAGPVDPVGLLESFEADRAPLDRGPRRGRVATGAVPFVPSAALVVRRRALQESGGFDEAVRVGEDVDLVWRLTAMATVRYEPDVVCAHETRLGLAEWLGQRVGYGMSAARLDRRHPGRATPIDMNVWTVVGWGLVATGSRRGAVAGLGVAAVSTAALGRKLHGRVESPIGEALRLAGPGHARAGAWLASALRRVWWPAALGAGVLSRRVRPGLAAAFIAYPLMEALARKPRVGVVRSAGLAVLDDVAYGAGVWLGCRRERSWSVLRPRLRRTTPGTNVQSSSNQRRSTALAAAALPAVR
ncbi:MAG: mycofactocin biosynthesis glycosyltransferase MftF [Acidimicrobiia bacterium]|nr:mycofactocin biosynthesis glycosyltransferase MftF [Acidimicrobiia bacterium]